MIFNSRFGFATPNPSPHHLSLINNLFVDIINTALTGLRKSQNNEFYYNTIINSGRSVGGGDSSQEFLCNVFIDAGTHRTNAIADFNVYYNSQQIANPGLHDLMFASAEDAQNSAYTFTIRRHSQPAEITIPDALMTNQSPHFELCAGANVGGTANLGVDDRLYDQLDPGFNLVIVSGGDKLCH